ncbi:MAG: LysR family transcriptional regulator [Aquamicrobium sp.]|jgi:DNA-binding transcriptional LysR family regulator|uniref:LysR family transcriptional regulator n=1 Tax=Bosea vestrisii TaxID=151416 RepID=A0ABW0H6Q9_9HYPH|nr:LysR family transcriptional regulator [Aquamicrobium sp.]
MRFSLRQLEYFIAAGETGSITLASEMIHISQPSISTAISHLERELNVQLFIRHHAQGLSLTPVGRALLSEAKRVVGQAESLYTVAADTIGTVRGTLSLGCMVTLAPMLVPELSNGFVAAFPETTIRHVEGNQEDLLRGLRRSEVDVALTYDLQVPDDIAFVPLVSLPPHIVVAETHPLAQQSAVTLEELAEQPLVLLDLPLSREYFLALFMAAGVVPTIAARSAYPDVVRAMVANGAGYALFNVRPRSDHSLDGRKLVSIRLAGEHRPMTIGVATLASLAKSKLIEAFQAHCEARISRAYIPGMIAPVMTDRPRVES